MLDIMVVNQGYGGLNPLVCGWEKCAPLHDFGPAVRRYYLIHYIVSGEGIFRTGGKEYHLHTGEMFVIHPEEESYYRADEKNPWHYIWIGFSVTNGLPCPLPSTIRLPSASIVFQKMIEGATKPRGCSAFLCARLWDLFTLLLEQNEGTQIDYVQYALDLIHAEYMNLITVEAIASRLGLNRSYFSTLFKSAVGVSPKRYLFEYRMRIAAALLTEDKTSVSVTANSVGYSDIFNFSKMFKQHYGVSPAEYARVNAK